ncbi:EGF-like repeat and discoidin I-like domain-containing protein 3 [Orbicella faveolata]|uniref:EGF-like repeat and discoidin I-like domain-containing protein 3 n=1 Tax=Orbicella faveolata TaxID=48498 RepID=UPI0009E635C0|nr:EGF-like repeat and discoidin I-like domain-containing protein 3 [Orbicella faveolata]
MEGKELQYDEETVYSQFYDIKHDCQLTGCLNAGSWEFIEVSKLFKRKCKDAWSGNYCAVCPVPLGMEDRTILDSQISASSVFAGNYAAQQARLHFKAGGGKTGGWSAKTNDDNQWLQVDLQQTTRITRIATQGRNGYTPGQWVTQYKLQYGEWRSFIYGVVQ